VPCTLACAAEHYTQSRVSLDLQVLLWDPHPSLSSSDDVWLSQGKGNTSAHILGRRDHKGDTLQLDIKKGEKKRCTWNIGRSMEQFLARPENRKGGLRAAIVRVGGSTILTLLSGY